MGIPGKFDDAELCPLSLEEHFTGHSDQNGTAGKRTSQDAQRIRVFSI